MALRGMIFDIDGTLVDTNPSHVEAWRRAFKRFGLAVSPTDCTMVGDMLEIASLAAAASE
jgi:beta-phosphoglucomutase-like phosphatase (HAD superfamily)